MEPYIRIVTSDRLSERDEAMLWELCKQGWADFSQLEWDHMVPGLHVLLEEDRAIVSHAAVVERALHVGAVPVRTGFVENVVTRADRRGRGYATSVMRAVDDHVVANYELGALDTGVHGFYERLGWERWRGPTLVRTADGPRRTPEEDDAVMVLRTPTTPPIDITEPISCDWRPGDAW
jgi:aminoglycoside 2'-N-acetyltransferase I